MGLRAGMAPQVPQPGFPFAGKGSSLLPVFVDILPRQCRVDDGTHHPILGPQQPFHGRRGQGLNMPPVPHPTPKLEASTPPPSPPPTHHPGTKASASRPGPPGSHLLHRGIAAGQLLAEVSNVVVTLLHVLLEVLSEVHQGFLHLAVQLLRTVLGGGTRSGPRGISSVGGKMEGATHQVSGLGGRLSWLDPRIHTNGWRAWCLSLSEPFAGSLLPPPGTHSFSWDFAQVLSGRCLLSKLGFFWGQKPSHHLLIPKHGAQ